MQGGTPERRKRRISVWQTLHISDPKLPLYLYCVVEKNVEWVATDLFWKNDSGHVLIVEGFF
jgi:hypothetical protein